MTTRAKTQLARDFRASGAWDEIHKKLEHQYFLEWIRAETQADREATYFQCKALEKVTGALNNMSIGDNPNA